MKMIETQADAIGIIDEAGLTGKVRNLTPAHDGQLGLVAALMLPDADLMKWENIFAAPFDRFRRAAPIGAKFHITDAFASSSAEWIAAAVEARKGVFDLVKVHNLLVVYTARDATIARRSHALLKEVEDHARASKLEHIAISQRPSNTRHVAECFQGVVSTIDVLAETFQLQHVALYSDEIDPGVRADMESAADRLRNLSKHQVDIRGYNKVRNTPVLRSIAFRMTCPALTSLELARSKNTERKVVLFLQLTSSLIHSCTTCRS